MVLEKGRFTPAAELSLMERDSSKEMYELGTLLTTQDAGACPAHGYVHEGSLMYVTSLILKGSSFSKSHMLLSVI